MDEGGFETYLRKGGRSPSATARCMRIAGEFGRFLEVERNAKSLKDATLDDLEAYVASIEAKPKASAKGQLWALRYYFDFTGQDEVRDHAAVLRQERIKRTPFALGQFRGVDATHIQRLSDIGIQNVDQMRQAGNTPAARQWIAGAAGVPVEAVLELVKLSDLARIQGLKGIRARLYCDAGVDTLDKLAQWEPEELRQMLDDFVQRTGFEGTAPLPKEAASAVAAAKKLPREVEF